MIPGPNIILTPEMQRRAEAKAVELGVSLDDYVRELVARDLGEPAQGFQEEGRGFGEPEPKADISIIFGLIDEGPPTNIARDKDKLIAEAVWDNYLRKVGRKPRRNRDRAFEILR